MKISLDRDSWESGLLVIQKGQGDLEMRSFVGGAPESDVPSKGLGDLIGDG